jgi:hypothetical protein
MACQARGLSTEEQNSKCEPPTFNYHGSYDALYMSHFNRLLSHRRYQKPLTSVVGLSQSFDGAAVYDEQAAARDPDWIWGIAKPRYNDLNYNDILT